MAVGVLVIGESGSGKSTSMRNLDPKETFLINVQGKDLPFMDEFEECPKDGPPSKGNLMVTDKMPTIKKVVKYISDSRPDIKYIVVDDGQYVFVNQFMNRLNEKGYDKFNELGKDIWSFPNSLKNYRKDLVVFYLHHDEKTMNDDGISFRRAKTMGKLISQQVGNIEGYFTYVIFTDVVKKEDGTKYQFVVKNEGDTTAKTPMGMFGDETRVENDLMLVVEQLKKFKKLK